MTEAELRAVAIEVFGADRKVSIDDARNEPAQDGLFLHVYGAHGARSVLKIEGDIGVDELREMAKSAGLPL